MSPRLERRNVARALVGAGLIGHACFLPISIAGTQIALGVAAAGLLLDLPKPLRSPLDWPALAFVLAAAGSDLLSPYGWPQLAAATLWRALLGFFIVFHGLGKAGDPRRAALRLLDCVSASIALAALVALLQYRTGFDPLHALRLRPEALWVEAPGVPGRFGAMGFFTSRLTFGHVLTILLAFAAGALAAGGLRRRGAWLVAAATALGVAAVGVTFDRAAWLALGAAAIVIAAFSGRPARRALAAALGALVLAAALQPAIRARFTSGFSSSANSDRVFIWSRALEIIRDHPLHGVGFANYPEICGRYYDRVDPGFFMRTWAHNLELSSLAEMGPLGLAALAWLLGAVLLALVRGVRRAEPFALGGLAAVSAWLVIAQVHDVLYDTKVMYALWFAVAAGLRCYRNESGVGEAGCRDGNP